MKDYSKFIESQLNFPKDGVMYWDFTPLIRNPEAFRNAIADIKEHFKNKKVTKIAAVEAKGFIIGAVLAYEMKLPLVLIRKPALTPGKVLSQKFIKEYGEGEYQIKEGVLDKKDNILIVYDIMAGSGATNAAISLMEKCGAKIAGCTYVIELSYLNGRKELAGRDIFSLVKIKNKYPNEKDE